MPKHKKNGDGLIVLFASRDCDKMEVGRQIGVSDTAIWKYIEAVTDPVEKAIDLKIVFVRMSRNHYQ